MPDLVTYDLSDGIATLTMDDGKVNAMSIPMLTELHGAFARAEADGAVVLLTGREGLTRIDYDAHRETKRRVRAACLEALRAAIESELAD